MPAAIPAILIAATAVSAGSAVYGAVDANQQRQHAKGAAEAQETAMNAQVKKAEDTDAANKNAKRSQASATQSAALAALKASMKGGNMGGSILTSGMGTGSTPPPVGLTKTLLGA